MDDFLHKILKDLLREQTGLLQRKIRNYWRRDTEKMLLKANMMIPTPKVGLHGMFTFQWRKDFLACPS